MQTVGILLFAFLPLVIGAVVVAYRSYVKSTRPNSLAADRIREQEWLERTNIPRSVKIEPYGRKRRLQELDDALAEQERRKRAGKLRRSPRPGSEAIGEAEESVSSEAFDSGGRSRWTNGYDGPLYFPVESPYSGRDLQPGSLIDGYHRVLVDSSIVPSREADWLDEVRNFALSFNPHMAIGKERALALKRAAFEDWKAGKGLSEGLTLLELRSILYMVAEFRDWVGQDPDGAGHDEFIGVLLEAIRATVNTNRIYDSSPTTLGEQFARFTIELAHTFEPEPCLRTPLSAFSLSDLRELIASIDETFQLPERDKTQPWLNLLNYRPTEARSWGRPEPIPEAVRRPTAEDVASGFSISDLIEIWLPHVIGPYSGGSGFTDRAVNSRGW